MLNSFSQHPSYWICMTTLIIWHRGPKMGNNNMYSSLQVNSDVPHPTYISHGHMSINTIVFPYYAYYRINNIRMFLYCTCVCMPIYSYSCHRLVWHIWGINSHDLCDYQYLITHALWCATYIYTLIYYQTNRIHVIMILECSNTPQ